MVPPSSRYRPGPVTSISRVWPPETSSTTSGQPRSGCSSSEANRWASRWLTPTRGTPQASDSALASATPDQQRADEARAVGDGHRLDARPGGVRPGQRQGLGQHRGQQLDVGPAGQLGDHPAVPGVQVDLAAHHRGDDRRSRRRPPRPPSRRTRSRCRAPGDRAPRRRRPVSRRTAPDPRARRAATAGRSSRAARPRWRPAAGVLLRVDVPDPHDQGVVPVGVVVGAHPDRRQAEPPVEGEGRLVADPDLEGEVPGPALERGADQVQQEHRAEPPALPGGGDRDVVHVGLVVDEHLAGEADQMAADPCGPVGPRRALGQLLHEQPVRPRLGEDLLLDAQDARRSLVRMGARTTRPAGGRAVRAGPRCRMIRAQPSARVTDGADGVPPWRPLLPVDPGVGMSPVVGHQVAAGASGSTPADSRREARRARQAGGGADDPGGQAEVEAGAGAQQRGVPDGAVTDRDRPAPRRPGSRASSASASGVSGSPAVVARRGRIDGIAGRRRRTGRPRRTPRPAGHRPPTPPTAPGPGRPARPRPAARTSRLLTPSTPRPSAWPSALAVATPTRRPVNRPGPTSTASASTSASAHPETAQTSSMAGARSSAWARPPCGSARPPRRRPGAARHRPGRWPSRWRAGSSGPPPRGERLGERRPPARPGPPSVGDGDRPAVVVAARREQDREGALPEDRARRRRPTRPGPPRRPPPARRDRGRRSRGAVEPVDVGVQQRPHTRRAGLDRVLPDQGEGGAGDRVGDPEGPPEPLGEGGLPGTEVAGQQDQVAGPAVLGERRRPGPASGRPTTVVRVSGRTAGAVRVTPPPRAAAWPG